MAILPEGRRLDNDAMRQAEIDRLRRELVRSKGGYDAVPIGVILPAYLTTAQVTEYFDSTGLGRKGRRYAGYAIVNGDNGTPSDLNGLFPRWSTSAAGGTGGSDSSAHTHSTPAHAHQTEIGWDGTNFYMKTNGSGVPASGSIVESVNRIPPAHGAVEGVGNARLALTRSDGSGTSGAASVTENRPAYYELVPVMRIS